MKIWIDLRFIKDWYYYSDFVLSLISELVKRKTEDSFIVYSNKEIKIKAENLICKNVGVVLWSISEQFWYNNILKKDKNDLVLFFDIHKPLYYNWDYYIFIPSLKNIYYQEFKNTLEKHKYLFYLTKSVKKAQKIICLDSNTKDELLERLDIKEEKVEIITGFFKWNPSYEKSELQIDIKSKNSIKSDFFIYPWWVWTEKNLDRLIDVFYRLNKDNVNVELVMIWDDISKSISLRNEVLSKKIEKIIHFLWDIKDNEKEIYYKSSLWVIFPSNYEPFPFSLNDAIFYNTSILSSKLKSIEDIFWETIIYFSPISTNSIVETIKEFINKKWNTKNVSSILEVINIENSVNQLIKLIY